MDIHLLQYNHMSYRRLTFIIHVFLFLRCCDAAKPEVNVKINLKIWRGRANVGYVTHVPSLGIFLLPIITCYDDVSLSRLVPYPSEDM